MMPVRDSSLEGLEAVRMRQGCISRINLKEGLHHLVTRRIDNSIDELWQGLPAIFKSLLSQMKFDYCCRRWAWYLIDIQEKQVGLPLRL